MLGRTNTLVRMAPDLSRNREQQGRGAAKHRASTDNLCLTSSPGQPGNFHISPGLLSLPISGVLHNTQHNNSPSFLNCLLSIKLAKYLKRWNKQIRGCIKTEVAMSAAQVTLRDTFHIHNLYLHHSQEPGQVTGEPGQDQEAGIRLTIRSQEPGVRGGKILLNCQNKKCPVRGPGRSAQMMWDQLTPT